MGNKPRIENMKKSKENSFGEILDDGHYGMIGSMNLILILLFIFMVVLFSFEK